MDKPEALAQLREYRTSYSWLMGMWGRLREKAVTEALEAGCTQTEIADALGISKQALSTFLQRREAATT